MKTSHLTLDTIAALLDGRLADDVRVQAEAHLAEGCAECRAHAEELGTALRALKSYSLTPVPGAAVERALASLRERGFGAALARKAGEALDRVAALVFDSWKTPATAGVRGSAVAPVRQLVYEWEDDRYTLHVQRDSETDPYVIRGRVFLTEGNAGAINVHLSPATTARARKAKTDASGEFVFETVRRGRYTVRIEAPGGDVTLSGIELP